MPLLSEYSPWPHQDLCCLTATPSPLHLDLTCLFTDPSCWASGSQPSRCPAPSRDGGAVGAPPALFPRLTVASSPAHRSRGRGWGAAGTPMSLDAGACPSPLSPSTLGQILPLMGFSCGDGEVAQAEPSAVARTGDEGGTLRPFPHARGRNSRNPPRRRPRPFRPAQGRPLGSALGLVTPTAGNPGKWPRPGMPTAARLRSQQGWRAALSGLNPPPRVRSGLGSRLAPLRPR